MNAKSKWLEEDGNIVAPNTLDSCVFGSDGKSLEEKLPFRFGINENGKYGYIKAGADSITPFGTGDGNSGLGECEILWSGLTELDTSQHDLTLDKSIDDYDYLLVSYWNLASSGECQMTNNIFIPKTDFYLKATTSGYENDAFVVGENVASTSVIYLAFGFKDNVTLTYRNGTTSNGYRTAIRAIYGIKKAGLHNYSTEEKVVGTWVDGKPVYEKVFQLENPTDSMILSENVEHLITQTGNFVQVEETNNEQLFPREYSPSISTMLINKNNNLLFYVAGINILRCTIIAQYTKTTDTATV